MASHRRTCGGAERAALAMAAAAAAGISAAVVRGYLRDVGRARRRVASGGRLAETAFGPIEYAAAGDGPPVLVVHGAGGGFDQGLDLAEPLVRSGFHVVAVSRFGYLGTPLPEDASAEAQADAHAALLDALGIARTAVVGASAGAPSSMQLAIRHPERVAALVLLVPAAYPTHLTRSSQQAGQKRLSAVTEALLSLIVRSDFVFWLGWRIARRTVARTMLGTPPEILDGLSADERARVATIAEHILPVSARRLGLLNEAAVTGNLPRYELERISAPTLVMSLEDDLFGTWEGARYTAEHVPNARFLGFPSGGHLFAGHGTELMREVVGFLRNEG
jgi:2-hydroxy-6-oxonona-2,4-dienedioate hydrolase